MTTTATATRTSSAFVQLENPPVVIHEHHHPLPVDRQKALLLHGVQQPYTLVTDHRVPSILQEGEILVKIVVIGLNPVDWKGPYVVAPPASPPMAMAMAVYSRAIGTAPLISAFRRCRGSMAATWPAWLCVAMTRPGA